MRKEIEITGCIEVQSEMTMEQFWDTFLPLIESKGWTFGGANEIVDGYYMNPDGTRGKHVLND